jgi:peptide-methionine (S)-S-oxide reductase
MKLHLLTTLLAMTSLFPSAHAADEPKPVKTAIATVGGGCFWCVEGAYKIVPGVVKVVSGYAGGAKENPTYKEVCSGTTGHAEVVQVEFDTAKLNYKDVIDLFLDLHDPTTLNRQGHDEGTQYRSIVLYSNDAEKKQAEQAVLDAKGKYPDPIVTQIVPLTKFYPAEDYHQDYFAMNPNAGYCQAVVGPKIRKFKEKLEARNNAKKP